MQQEDLTICECKKKPYEFDYSKWALSVPATVLGFIE